MGSLALNSGLYLSYFWVRGVKRGQAVVCVHTVSNSISGCTGGLSADWVLINDHPLVFQPLINAPSMEQSLKRNFLAKTETAPKLQTSTSAPIRSPGLFLTL